MSSQDLLMPMFSYSLFPILLLIIIIGIMVFFLVKPKKKDKEPVIVKPPTKNLFEIKDRYLKKINNLEQEIIEEKIANRNAYIKLSMIIRHFIYEVTQIKVQNYSLQEIIKVNIPPLTALVEEYYNPEFAKESKGEIHNSLKKTREVIDKWQ